MLDVKLVQSAIPPTVRAVDRLAVWIILTPAQFSSADWARLPYGTVLHKRARRAPTGSQPGPRIETTDLPNRRATRVVYSGIEPDISAFELLGLARLAVKAALAVAGAELALSVYGFDEAIRERIAEALISAALASAVQMPSYKRKAPLSGQGGATPERVLTRIRLLGLSSAHRFERSFAEARGNGLARYLTALPPNELTPGNYRRRLESLAKEHGFAMEFLDVRTLRRRKAGAFLAVAQGSPVDDAGIARLCYRPRGARRRPLLALVGKGICFDTGGVNVKPNRYMLGMHEDMEGSAVALGTLLALSELGVDFAIDCWLALATNHIGNKAYKPNDVVTALDGSTIEIIHTDAEGRMVLADTLTLASRTRPSLIIDYATLTGACVYSLGKAYSGVFTNRDGRLATLIDAGRDSGERVWPFPQDADYDRFLESTIADVKQCATEGEADHILAARFLRRFIKHDVPWVHIDLSAGSHKGGLAHIPTDVTGFGVRYTCNLVLDKKALEGP